MAEGVTSSSKAWQTKHSTPLPLKKMAAIMTGLLIMKNGMIMIITCFSEYLGCLFRTKN
jgi:hypothetical protein